MRDTEHFVNLRTIPDFLNANIGKNIKINSAIKNSVQDTWLNTIVNRYNPFGHKGVFFTHEDSLLLAMENFLIDTKIKKYTWWFNDEQEMVTYIKNLFYLSIDNTELRKVIDYNLKPYLSDDNKVHFDWELMYFICTKSNL